MSNIDSEFIEKYLDLYSETQGLLPKNLENYGDKYKEQNYLTREQLYEIAFEASTRSAYHVRRNPEKRCRKVTENIMKMEDDFSQIALICSLKGFKAAIGSAVLTALDPETHTVIDTRVWAALERKGYFSERREVFGPEEYVEMMETIRNIADETGHSTADIGYALFAYDYDVREGNLH